MTLEMFKQKMVFLLKTVFLSLQKQWVFIKISIKTFIKFGQKLF